MYSVVLMAALAASGQTPDWGGRQYLGNCYGGCYGNYGIDSYGCYGSCWGNSYTCSGCYGSCFGTCWGSGYGCYGNYPWEYSSCGCHGCLGAESAYFPTAPAYGPPVVAPPEPPGKTVEPPKGEPLPEPKKTSPEGLAPTNARLIVEAPADARLYIDDRAMKTEAEVRTYQTPELDPGQTYFSDVRVELERDGKTLTASKRVLVKAGQDAHADFKDMETTATAKAK